MASTVVPLQFGVKQSIGSRPLLEDRARAARVSTAGGLKIVIAIVADGIGGENAGERAAQLTVDTFVSSCRDSRETDVRRLLKSALEAANTEVYLEAQMLKKTHGDMGCTAAVAIIYEGRLYVGNVGDSRIYLVRGQNVVQLTSDHTWGNEMVRSERRTPAEVARHPRRDEITRSIGQAATVEVDLEMPPSARHIAGQEMKLLPSDRVVICSDGLIKTRLDAPGYYATPAEIARIVNSYDPPSAVDRLIELADQRRADDNVSVIVLKMPGGDPISEVLAVGNRWLNSKSFIAATLGGVVTLVFIGSVAMLFAPSRQQGVAPPAVTVSSTLLFAVTVPRQSPAFTTTLARVNTATATPVATATPTYIDTATSSLIVTATPSLVLTATQSRTATATPSPTPTATRSPTFTATLSPVITATPSPTPTATPLRAATATPTLTPTRSPTFTSTSSPVATVSPSRTATSTPSPTTTAKLDPLFLPPTRTAVPTVRPH